VLSDHEQRVWDDVRQFWDMEAEDPRRPTLRERHRKPRPRCGSPACVLLTGWISFLLVLFGAPVAALCLLGLAVLGWSLSQVRGS
jgi:hypothetical protein